MAEEKSFGEQMHDGIIRGIAGKEEDTSKARIHNSPEPMPDEMVTIKRLYMPCIILCAIGIFIPACLAIGALALMIVFCIDVSVVDRKRDRLRRAKFKIGPNVTNEDVLQRMIPVLTSKYGMLVEKNKKDNSTVTVTHQTYLYDIILEDDQTFIVWWRQRGTALVGSSFRSKYHSYKLILAAMGIISYEMQQSFGTGEKITGGMENVL